MSLGSANIVQKSIQKTFDLRRRRSEEQGRSSDRVRNVRRCDRNRNVVKNMSFTYVKHRFIENRRFRSEREFTKQMSNNDAKI